MEMLHDPEFWVALVFLGVVALERIAQSEAQAVAQVRNTAVDVALAAAEKLIQGSLDQGKKQALADKAIAELPGRLN